ncbi:hypothetical protein NCC49_001819 [Naganishia albida]|nr:hypothetical protein NCC49_001819 [Naganishia albida]
MGRASSKYKHKKWGPKALREEQRQASKAAEGAVRVSNVDGAGKGRRGYGGWNSGRCAGGEHESLSELGATDTQIDDLGIHHAGPVVGAAVGIALSPRGKGGRLSPPPYSNGAALTSEIADFTDTFVTLSPLDQRMERLPTCSPERHPLEPEAEHELEPRAQSRAREPEGDESDEEEDVEFEDHPHGHEQDGEKWGNQEEAEENDQEGGKDVDAGDGIDQELLQSAAAKGGVSNHLLDRCPP